MFLQEMQILLFICTEILSKKAKKSTFVANIGNQIQVLHYLMRFQSNRELHSKLFIKHKIRDQRIEGFRVD